MTSSELKPAIIISNFSPINTPQQQQQQTPIIFFTTQQPHENSSQSVNTVHTSSLFDIKQSNSTNVTTTIGTQQSIGIYTQLPSPIIPTSIYHVYTLQANDSGTSPIHNGNDSSLYYTSGLDDTTTEEADDHLPPSPITKRINHHQRFNSLLNKKRQRSRSYEHDPFMNKRIKSRSLIEDTELIIPNITTTITSFNNLHSHKNDSLFIYSNQRTPSSTFEGFHQHISLLTDTAENERRISLKDSQIFSTSSRTTSTPRSSFITSTTTTIPTVVQSNFSSTKCINKTSNNDVLPSDPREWTIVQVGEFIKQITNEGIAEAFRKSEVDGEALLLLKKEELRHDMNIKLGPSVKILNKIKELRERI